MGTKRGLAPSMGAAIAPLPAGPVLDLFAGMCSVAGSIAESGRPVWCNDVQAYAELVARVLVMSTEVPPTAAEARRDLRGAYARNLNVLRDRFDSEIADEQAALLAGYTAYARLAATWRHVGNDTSLGAEASAESAALRRGEILSLPYRLCSITFANGYFGLSQATQIDSLRYAIDLALVEDRITAGRHRWYLVALLQAASHVVTAPGHFAQFLKVRDGATFARVSAYRKRCIWEQLLVEIGRIEPFGSVEWRSRNRAFLKPAQDLLSSSALEEERPAVVYADPPYTTDQYSRFYHVLETLTRYDYPDATGEGRYRSDRFVSPFSLASQVIAAFQSLATGVAALDAALVLSYPAAGLLHSKLATKERLAASRQAPSICEILNESYRSVKVTRIDHYHSTMGGSPGRSRTGVEEVVYVATDPR